jgi:hypothetical protein
MDVLQGAEYHIHVCAMAFHAYRILQLRAWCIPSSAVPLLDGAAMSGDGIRPV